MTSHNQICTDEEFTELFNLVGPRKLAKFLQYSSDRPVFARAARLKEAGHKLAPPIQDRGIAGTVSSQGPTFATIKAGKTRITADIESGHAIIFNDCHYWPGEISVAHRGVVHLVKELQPRVIAANGDVADFPRISRFPRIGWDSTPTVNQELKTIQERLTEVEDVAPVGALTVWNLGNHDSRFEVRLAANATEYEGVPGMSLKDHFPRWKPAWSTWINDQVVIKHRWKNGVWAPRNNTIHSGKSFVSGHLHAAQVIRFSDYNGTRYGVDSGMVGEPYGPQFDDYTEDSPKDWRSSFCVLTFHKGKLLVPELASKFDDDHIEFRGKLIRV